MKFNVGDLVSYYYRQNSRGIVIAIESSLYKLYKISWFDGIHDASRYWDDLYEERQLEKI